MITCITNQMAELRPCVVKDDHYDECDGFEYAWVEKRGREEATGRACRGCLPRTASTGLVCMPCWRQIVSAVAGYPELARALEGVDRAVVGESSGMTAHGGPGVPLSAVQLSLEEINSFDTINGQTPEQWVSSEAGARDAVRFGRAYSSAVAAHPIKETSHPIRLARCPDCKQRTLVWHAPTTAASEVRVRCRNPECSYDVDQDTYEHLPEAVIAREFAA